MWAGPWAGLAAGGQTGLWGSSQCLGWAPGLGVTGEGGVEGEREGQWGRRWRGQTGQGLVDQVKECGFYPIQWLCLMEGALHPF